jgi:hypothetical protein
MSSHVSPSPGTLPPEGLPPVKPPSGKFIAQLFLVPLLIVLCILALFFTLRGLFGIGGPRTAEQFLHSLDQTNADVRWRAAQDLAQVLLRDDKLAADPAFALDLAERLRNTLRESDADEKALQELTARLPSQPTEEDKKAVAKATNDLTAARKYAVYLAASLGSFSVPVGVPLLKEMALQTSGQEPKALAHRRRQAVWALANLGMNQQRFDSLTQVEKDAAIHTLTQESLGSGERGRWAKLGLERLEARLAGKPKGLGDEYLTLADAEDPFLRELLAFSLNFWEGNAQENERMDETLERLSHDDGNGESMLAQLSDEENQETQAITKSPGLKVRYNATIALARRGSPRVRIAVLKQMLDEKAQMQNFRRTQKDGKEVADEALARQTVLAALKAAAQLHRRQPTRDLSELRPLIENLTASDNAAVRTEAKTTLLALDQSN